MFLSLFIRTFYINVEFPTFCIYGDHAGHLVEMAFRLQNRLFIWVFWGISQWCDRV